MSDDAAHGRRQLIGIAAAVWLPQLIGRVVDGFRLGPSALLMAAVPMLLLLGMVRGWGWARWWTGLSLGLAYGVLSRSESIEAYCEYREGGGRR